MNINNKIKNWLLLVSNIEIIVILILLAFSYSVYLLNSHVHELNLELKNLTSLIESLENVQNDLKNQLLLKNQQIKILEDALIELQFKLSSLSYINHTPQNFELLKEEILEINKNEMIQFCKKISGVIISVFLAFLITNYFGKASSVYKENFELSLIDSAGELIWFIKIIDNKKAEILIKNFTTQEYEFVGQVVKTLILKSSGSISKGSLDNIEIISSFIPVTEKVITATQITEIISSFGIS